nr:MAG TPA: hypothetical protein [Caudoviricetes sp.]
MNNFSILIISATSGNVFPFSHLLQVAGEIPSFSAICSCVRLAPALNIFKVTLLGTSFTPFLVLSTYMLYYTRLNRACQ